MGYHVSILRTGQPDNRILEAEITTIVEGRFGFTIERTDTGLIKQLFRDLSGEEAPLFYDDGELWTTNPSEPLLEIMIEIATALGNGARVRGDEGETYKTMSSTFIHQDDRELIKQTPRIYTKDILSWFMPALAISLCIYYLVKYIVKHYF